MPDICLEMDKEGCRDESMAVLEKHGGDRASGTDPGEFEISTEKERLDLSLIHDFLANRSYWARHIPFEAMKKSIDNSLCFGVYHGNEQVGFARVMTDFVTIAYLGDVFIVEAYRGRGLGKRLTESILSHPELRGVRLWFLATRDAQGLYQKYGFRNLDNPGRFMVRPNPEVYDQGQGGWDAQKPDGRKQAVRNTEDRS
jgi:GNAT superfamily N-acetyltransferase